MTVAHGAQSFGATLRRFRQAAGLSQEALSERAGLSLRGLSDLERGASRGPRLDTLNRLVQALELGDVARRALFGAAGIPPLDQSSNMPAEPLSAPAPTPFLAAVRGYRSSDSGPRWGASLPLPLTSFVGRQSELAEVEQLLRGTRLMTLTGTGGVGKTRLALRLIEDVRAGYADGVCLVELESVTDPRLLPEAVARALDLREVAGRRLLDTLIDALMPANSLLVLDNCEHLLEAAASLVVLLLRRCPGLRVLTTSREPLGVPGEVVWRLAGLAVPVDEPRGALDALAAVDAVRLFVERARAARADFGLDAGSAAAVIEICRRLDGLPLALELAAACVRVLGLAEIAARLGAHLDLPPSSPHVAPPRHRTLRAVIGWSYDLLNRPEQVLFERLAVFVGGWTLEAAELLCSDDDLQVAAVLPLLTHLVDASLVIAEPAAADGRTRFRFLESVRAYAWERLEARGETLRFKDRHAGWVLNLVQQAEHMLHGPEESAWLQRLEDEHANVWAALAWAIETEQTSLALELAGGLDWYWFVGPPGGWAEGRDWLQRALELPRAAEYPASQTRALDAAGRLACFQADFDAAWTWLHATEAIAREHADERLLLSAEGNRALLLQQTGAFEAAAEVARATLIDARRLGNAWLEGRLLSVLARVALQRSDHTAAASCLEEAVALARRTRDRLSLAFALDELGDVERSRGSYERAGVLYEECLHILEGHRARAGSIPSLLHNLGYVALAAGDTRLATARFEQALADFLRQRDQRGMSECLLGLGAVAAAEGRAADAARLFGAGEAALETLGAELWPSNRADYARGVAMARLALDAVAFEDAWREGRRVALDEAALSILARH